MNNTKLAITFTKNKEEEIETSVTIDGEIQDIIPAYLILSARIFEGLFEADKKVADEFINNIGNDIKETLKILKENDGE